VCDNVAFLVCRRFGDLSVDLSPFRFVAVLTINHILTDIVAYVCLQCLPGSGSDILVIKIILVLVLVSFQSSCFYFI